MELFSPVMGGYVSIGLLPKIALPAPKHSERHGIWGGYLYFGDIMGIPTNGTVF